MDEIANIYITMQIITIGGFVLFSLLGGVMHWVSALSQKEAYGYIVPALVSLLVFCGVGGWLTLDKYHGDNKAKQGIVIQRFYEDNEYHLHIQLEGNEDILIDTDKSVFLSIRKGDLVSIEWIAGRYTENRYDIQVNVSKRLEG